MSLVQLDQELPRIDMYAPAFRRRVLETRRQVAAETAKAAGLDLIVIRKARRTEARRLAWEAKQAAKQMLADARMAVENIVRDDEMVNPRPLAMAIIKDVAEKSGFNIGIIIGASRNKHVVAARHQAMALVHIARPDLSLPAIGRMFGRDHTTVLHALIKTGAYLNPRALDRRQA